MLDRLASFGLGHYGVYCNPSAEQGFVWANIDHSTDFSAASPGLPDFEPDGDVEGADFAWFAPNWQNTSCGVCGGADLTGDGNVDFYDLKEFTENWLAGL